MNMIGKVLVWESTTSSSSSRAVGVATVEAGQMYNKEEGVTDPSAGTRKNTTR